MEMSFTRSGLVLKREPWAAAVKGRQSAGNFLTQVWAMISDE